LEVRGDQHQCATHTGKMGSLHKLALVLLFCLVASGRAAEYAKYKDPKQPVSVRVKDLLSRMTLAEKIGQMTQIERENATADALAKYFIGMPDYTTTKHTQ
jgi:beta-glucosidase